MTGSHEQMKKIENNPQARKAWINSNLEFMKKEYGEKNIVRFSVHRDEKTMHIHAVTVPSLLMVVCLQRKFWEVERK